jgi:beta-lactamase superfamily II metal-dependent hydrolase
VILLLVSFVLASCVSPSVAPKSTTAPTSTSLFQTSSTTTSSQSSTTITSTSTTTSITTQSLLDVYFIDVGQGDSILIDQGQTEVLIDAGTGSVNVANFIKQYVDGPLEAVVATHTDADHIGGLDTILNTYKVSEVWTNSQTATTVAYSNFISSIQSNGATTHTARRGDKINVGTLSFSVLNPANLSGTTNNNSIVLNLNYGDTDFLFEGDAEQEAEAGMLSAGIVPHADILKVGHHGSRTASSPAFLAVVKPEVAVYMCGVGNMYGHPHQETLNNLAQIGAKVYGTDVNGTVKIETDGKNYTVQVEKQGTPKAPTTTTTSTSQTTSTTTQMSTTTSLPVTSPSTNINVQITKIFYDGLVPTVESDEYVEITNLGSIAVDLKGWLLKDVADGYPSFTFPAYVLQSGKSIRVYTNEIHPEYGGFSFGYGKAIWNNTQPDTAGLFNAQGQEVSRKSY